MEFKYKCKYCGHKTSLDHFDTSPNCPVCYNIMNLSTEIDEVIETGEDKMVTHPDHYQSDAGLEVITVVEAFTANLTGIEATDTGNILKYMCRWKKKNGLQDLKKAKWYLEHLINHVEKENA